MTKTKKDSGTNLDTINKDFGAIIDQLLRNLKIEVMDEMRELMQDFNFPDQSNLKIEVMDEIRELMQDFNFSDQSIPFSAINLDQAIISGNIIASGMIRKFSSTGIEDLAKHTKLTVMDSMVVVENKLVAQKLFVKGNVVIDGNVTINGDTGFDKTTMNNLVHNIGKRVYTLVGADLARGLENISGDHIIGGTITGFSSTGIEDLAKKTQLTILDKMVVVENKLVAQSLFVKGDTVIDGNLVIRGDLPLDDKTTNRLISKISEQVHEQISNDIKNEIVDSLITRIKATQFDVKNILIAGRPLIDGDSALAPFIRDTRITRVGTLKQLEVTGETQLCGSFYAGNKRIGINTTEPAAALAIWDEEVEIVIGKHSSNKGYMGTLRQQEVIIGAHNKTNIILAINGLTTIKTLIAAETRFYSGDTAPNFESNVGAVCFNTKPDIGKPSGWMCLGGARWGIMSKIQ